MFDTLIARPLLNILVSIYALIPGHSFGVAIIIFTLLTRFAMWPLVKKQLHHGKAMRKLQPDIKKIKKANKGDKAAEAAAISALYKEREINPFGGFGLLLIQMPVLFALYRGINKIAQDPQEIVNESYGFVRDLPWMQKVAEDITLFNSDFLGFFDLTRSATSDEGWYGPALIIILASAVVQYVTSKQLMVTQGESRKLRDILKDQSEGKEVDQAEVGQAVTKSTVFILPIFIMFISLSLVLALPFYWMTSGIIAFLQQRKILAQDVDELNAVVDGEAVEAEVVKKPKRKKPKTSKKKQPAKKKKVAKKTKKKR